LSRLCALRLTADDDVETVGQRAAQRACASARVLVEAVGRRINGQNMEA
jgi:hypothetical protein